MTNFGSSRIPIDGCECKKGRRATRKRRFKRRPMDLGCWSWPSQWRCAGEACYLPGWTPRGRRSISDRKMASLRQNQAKESIQHQRSLTAAYHGAKTEGDLLQREADLRAAYLEAQGFRMGYQEGAEDVGKMQGKASYFLKRHGVGMILGAIGLWYLNRRRR